MLRRAISLLAVASAPLWFAAPAVAESAPVAVEATEPGEGSPVDVELRDALASVNRLGVWFESSPISPELTLLVVSGPGAESARAELLGVIGDLATNRSLTAGALRELLDAGAEMRTLGAAVDALTEQSASLAVERRQVALRRISLLEDLEVVSEALVDTAVGLYVDGRATTAAAIDDVDAYNDSRQLEIQVESTLEDLISRRDQLVDEIDTATAELAAYGAALVLVDATLEELGRLQQETSYRTTLIRGRLVQLAESKAESTEALPDLMAAAQRSRLLAAEATTGIPLVNLDAYRKAAGDITETFPDCAVQWELLAGIAAIESTHGSHGGATIEPSGDITGRHIFGPLLDGSVADTKVVADSDNGYMDGNASYDRAVGPFQFLPSSWRIHGVDATGDGYADPHNLYDAALSAAAYLCSISDVDDEGLRAAVLSYNNSIRYLDLVTSRAVRYAESFRAPPPDPDPAGLRLDGDLVAQAQMIRAAILD